MIDVLVTIPSHGTMDIEPANALGLAVHYGIEQGLNVATLFSDQGDVAGARRALAKTAIEMEARYTLSVDTDIILPRDVIPRLLAHEKPVVGGLYFKRKPPYEPVAYLVDDAGWHCITRLAIDGLMAVDWLGMGCVLVEAQVFADMAKFFNDECWFLVDEFDGEDAWFCKRLKQMGVPVYLDCTVQCGHVATRIITAADWQRERR